MALMYCPECGKQISDAAEVCPSCGFPIKEPETLEQQEGTENSKEIGEKKRVPGKRTLIGIIAAVVLVVVVLVLVLSNRLNATEQEHVDEVIAVIDSIGEVGTNSLKKIELAEAVYADLTPKEQRHVSNRKDLKDARASYDQVCAEAVDAMIDKIGEVDLSSGKVLDTIQEAYDFLTEEQKALLKNEAQLTEAENTYHALQVEDVEEKISEIGEVHADADTKAKIRTARGGYDKLDLEQQEQVKNYQALEEAEEAYTQAVITECMELIDSIGEVTLDKEEMIHQAEALYKELPKERRSEVTNSQELIKASDVILELKKAEEEAAKLFNIGDTVEGKNWELTLKNATLTERILPDNTRGYYLYYYPKDGSIYVDLALTIKNTGNSIQGISDIVGSYKITYGDKDLFRAPTLYFSIGDDIEKVYDWNGLGALKSGTLHIADTLPQEAMTDGLPVTVTVTLCGKEKIVKVR